MSQGRVIPALEMVYISVLLHEADFSWVHERGYSRSSHLRRGYGRGRRRRVRLPSTRTKNGSQCCMVHSAVGPLNPNCWALKCICRTKIFGSHDFAVTPLEDWQQSCRGGFPCHVSNGALHLALATVAMRFNEPHAPAEAPGHSDALGGSYMFGKMTDV